MARNFDERIGMKYSISQLERIIVALLNNGNNKKFATNVNKLFSMFTKASYQNDLEKEVRVHIVRRLSELILKDGIKEKDAILSWLDMDGKFQSETTEVINRLFENDLSSEELAVLDRSVSDSLRFGFLDKDAASLIDELNNLQNENYDSLPEMISTITTKIEKMNKNMRDAKESLENEKERVNLNSQDFVRTLGTIIQQERNPSSKVQIGIRAFNEMVNGGFEKGRLYCALGVAKG